MLRHRVRAHAHIDESFERLKITGASKNWHVARDGESWGDGEERIPGRGPRRPRPCEGRGRHPWQRVARRGAESQALTEKTPRRARCGFFESPKKLGDSQ